MTLEALVDSTFVASFRAGQISHPQGDREDGIRVRVKSENSAKPWRILIEVSCTGPGSELVVVDVNGLQYACGPDPKPVFNLPLTNGDQVPVVVSLLGSPPSGAYVHWLLKATWTPLN